MPWSWGHGVRVSTEENWVLGPIEVRAADVQEKMGGVPHIQTQGTEQVRFLGWLDSRVSRMRMSGVWVRAGDDERERNQEGVSKIWP